MSFTDAELAQLRLADQVEDQPGIIGETPSERRARHSRESVERRIARIGLAEWKRIKSEAAARWAAKRHANNPQETR